LVLSTANFQTISNTDREWGRSTFVKDEVTMTAAAEGALLRESEITEHNATNETRVHSHLYLLSLECILVWRKIQTSR
jgi:hypothetical protein